MELFKQGEAVKVTFYGEERIGKVTRNQKTSIVFVSFDDSKRERWFNAESLTRA